MNSSPSIQPTAEARANEPASNPPASTAAATAPSAAAKREESSPTEPLRQNDVAWPVVQATAEAVAQAAGTQKPARKSAKPAAKAAERSAAAKPRPPGKRAAKAAATPAAKPAAKAVVKPAAKAPKKDRAASAPKSDTTAVVAAKAPRAKEKLVRDSFTMPRTDYALISQLKQRGLGFKREVRKSELLRAGLQVLAAMDDAALKALLDKLPRIKTGRPRKAD